MAGVESAFLLLGAGGVPGGPTTSLVLTFQGDRLDPATAEDRNNYRVTWLGADGQRGTADDRVIPLSSSAQAVVYSPGSNVDIGTGLADPTAIRQTVTLLFDQPLPAGSYVIELSPQIQTADFNPTEDSLLAGNGTFAGHPVANRLAGSPFSGAEIEARDLVFAAAGDPDFASWAKGTPFLSQLHDDLSAILDSALTSRGDDLAISQQINDQIRARLAPARAAGAPGILVLWLDPTSFTLDDTEDKSILYDLEEDVLAAEIDMTYVDVIGNIEVIVIAVAKDLYNLVVDDVPALVRGGFVFVDDSGVISELLTDDLRSGDTDFDIELP